VLTIRFLLLFVWPSIIYLLIMWRFVMF